MRQEVRTAVGEEGLERRVGGRHLPTVVALPPALGCGGGTAALGVEEIQHGAQTAEYVSQYIQEICRVSRVVQLCAVVGEVDGVGVGGQVEAAAMALDTYEQLAVDQHFDADINWGVKQSMNLLTVHVAVVLQFPHLESVVAQAVVPVVAGELAYLIASPVGAAFGYQVAKRLVRHRDHAKQHLGVLVGVRLPALRARVSGDVRTAELPDEGTESPAHGVQRGSGGLLEALRPQLCERVGEVVEQASQPVVEALRHAEPINVFAALTLHLPHEALEAHEEIPVYLAGQLPQLLGHLVGKVFQRVLRGLHVVTPRLLGELRDCLFNLTVYEAFNVFYFLPFYVIGVGEELVAHGDGLLEVTDAEGVNLCLDFCEVFVDVMIFEKPQLPIHTTGFARNLGAQFTKEFVDVRDCIPVELCNCFFNAFKSISFASANLLNHVVHIPYHASFICIFAILTQQLLPQPCKLIGDFVDALLYFSGLFVQLTLLSAEVTHNFLETINITTIKKLPTCLFTQPIGHQIGQRLDDVTVQRAPLRFEFRFDC
ncbi:amino acid peptide transporter, putative [Babesia ovata]|uniref:Amino acid peptide transporter, putative n=1 Tax=Babesia ovata TaxID=189622 RepID=A0A2H6KJX3_9APIC|nr:amino acid peptide transporter, putative [Babesia ovata]GBE63279.1 amino acid peptide transporter, putative [Babesia ovata]